MCSFRRSSVEMPRFLSGHRRNSHSLPAQRPAARSLWPVQDFPVQSGCIPWYPARRLTAAAYTRRRHRVLSASAPGLRGCCCWHAHENAVSFPQSAAVSAACGIPGISSKIPRQECTAEAWFLLYCGISGKKLSLSWSSQMILYKAGLLCILSG